MLSRPEPSPPENPGAARLVISSDPHTVRNGLRTLMQGPPLDRLSADHRGTVELVLAEVLNNIVEHAYARSPGLIDISVAVQPWGIACQIMDQGAELPGGAPPGVLPDGIAGTLDELPEGGFGWHLIRTLTTDLSYRRIGGRNHLYFVIPVVQPS